jgi:DNA-binding transcriptional ArsR family regulator
MFYHLINISLNDDALIQMKRLSLKAKLFRGLADSTRLSILESLRDGEKTTSEIVKETKHNQSNISNHLSCLLDCGLVKNRKDGKNTFYSLSNKKVAKLLEESDVVLSEIVNGLYLCVNYNEKSSPEENDDNYVKR